MTQSIIRLYQAIIDYGVMKRHCELSKRALSAELDDLEETMHKDLEGYDENEQDAYFRDVNDYWIETAETLPRLQWYSQLLIAVAYFEKSLNDLCDCLRKEKGYTLSFKDLHGQGILRAKNYLVKVASIPDVFASLEWQRVQQLSELRNIVAHRNGFVDYDPTNPRSLYCQFAAMEHIELRQELLNQPDAQVLFGPEFILESLTVFESFSRNLAANLKAG